MKVLFENNEQRTNRRGRDKYSLPEVSEFIKPELYMPNSTSECNQNGNIHGVEGHIWDDPLSPHVAPIIQRLCDMDNYSIQETLYKTHAILEDAKSLIYSKILTCSSSNPWQENQWKENIGSDWWQTPPEISIAQKWSTQVIHISPIKCNLNIFMN